ncbi:MAG: glutathione S-transferase [Sphingomonas sp.]
MQLFHSATSPFVRKVMIVAEVHGLADRIERLPASANPVAADAGIVARNPLGQVPTLVLADGRVLADSRVICEYLDHLGGATLFPRDGTRWAVLAAQSLADGLMDAALLCRYETTARPEPLRWPEWERGQRRKIADALAVMAAEAPALGDRLDIGTIGYACALGYLDFRFAALDWRAAHPALAAWYARFAERPEMRATRP